MLKSSGMKWRTMGNRSPSDSGNESGAFLHVRKLFSFCPGVKEGRRDEEEGTM